jgi:hypothetical protein
MAAFAGLEVGLWTYVTGGLSDHRYKNKIIRQFNDTSRLRDRQNATLGLPQQHAQATQALQQSIDDLDQNTLGKSAAWQGVKAVAPWVAVYTGMIGLFNANLIKAGKLFHPQLVMRAYLPSLGGLALGALTFETLRHEAKQVRDQYIPKTANTP